MEKCDGNGHEQFHQDIINMARTSPSMADEVYVQADWGRLAITSQN